MAPTATSSKPRGARLNGLLLRAGVFLTRLLPRGWGISLAGGCGYLWGHVAPGREVVATNLEAIRRARPTPAVIAGSPATVASRRRVRPAHVYASYGRYWGELLALAADPRFAIDSIRVEGEQHLEAALARGPVCLLTGHLGNWDMGAYWAATRLRPFAVVSEMLEDEALRGWFLEFRRRTGCLVYPAHGSGRALYRHLRQGGHLALVNDRPIGGRGRLVPFLGGKRLLPETGHELARRAGATLVPAFLVRRGRGYAIKVHAPLPAGEDPTVAFARILEEAIAAHPDQWCVLRPLHDGRGEAERSGA